jgi:hypothetical protein
MVSHISMDLFYLYTFDSKMMMRLGLLLLGVCGLGLWGSVRAFTGTMGPRSPFGRKFTVYMLCWIWKS